MQRRSWFYFWFCFQPNSQFLKAVVHVFKATEKLSLTFGRGRHPGVAFPVVHRGISFRDYGPRVWPGNGIGRISAPPSVLQEPVFIQFISSVHPIFIN